MKEDKTTMGTFIYKPNKVLEALKKNVTPLGMQMYSHDPDLIEIVGYAGFDFVILDMEHGPNGLETVQNLIRAAQLTQMLPVVRVEENNLQLIGKVLDIGAGAIQIPQVTCAEDIRRVLNHAKFSPDGMRGVCRFVRAADYSSMARERYFKEANKTIVIVQLEGKEAIENIDEILEAGGFEILFIGPYDLSQSLGVPGQVDHPLVEEKMREIIERCQGKDVYVGNFTDTIENARKWIRSGVRYISYSVDVGLFTEACRTTVQRLRSVQSA